MRRSILFVALLGEGLLLGVHAQTTTLNSLRLSEWLEQQPAQPDAYPLGLVWATPEEKTRQVGEHAALQTQLRAMLKQSQISDRDFLGLQHALHALEPTGRVRVASASGKWLAANPKRELTVGGNGLMISKFGNLFPRLTDLGLEAVGKAMQQADQPPPPESHDNLWRPKKDEQ